MLLIFHYCALCSRIAFIDDSTIILPNTDLVHRPRSSKARQWLGMAQHIGHGAPHILHHSIIFSVHSLWRLIRMEYMFGAHKTSEHRHRHRHRYSRAEREYSILTQTIFTSLYCVPFAEHGDAKSNQQHQQPNKVAAMYFNMLT